MKNIKQNIMLLTLIMNLLITSSILAKPEDTLRTKLPELNVSADKLFSNSAFKFSASDIINNKTIEKISPWQIPEILNLSPGIFINNYGGLGGLKTVSMRGTSSNQALVMINGVKINSTQSGIFDFSKFPASFFNNIEIVRGGASTLFGGNAIGGIINLRTENINPRQITFLGGYKFGSFRQQEEFASLSFKSWGVSNSLFYNHTFSNGNYPVIDENGNDLFERENAQYDNYSFGIINNFKIKSWNNSITSFLNWSKRGIPGAVIKEQTEIAPSDEKLKEKSAIVIFNAKNQINDETAINIGLNSQIDYFNYTDPDFLGDLYEGLNSKFTNRNVDFSIRFSTFLSSFITDFGFESSFSDLRGNQLNKSIGDYVKRTNIALFGRMENDFDLSDDFKLNYNFGIRTDYFSDVYTAVSPMAGVLLDFKKLPFKFKFNWSYNFRPPSFNEMYYLNFGNSHLKPERSQSYNLGFSWVGNDLIDLNFNLFYLTTKNQIVAIPKNQISWSASNIANVKTQGMEISFNSYFFNKNLRFILSYTLQNAVDDNTESLNYNKMIAYVPEEILSSTLNYSLASFDFGTVLKYSSFYYSLSDNSYESLISAYSIINLYVVYSQKLKDIRFKYRLDINNLLNYQYSIIKNYPMPGRYFRLGATLYFN